MNPAKRYLGDIIGGSIMLRESRVIAELLLSNPDTETWLQKIDNQNILQKNSRQSAKRFASTIRKRLEPMGKEFLSDFIEADEPLAGQMMLLAIMNNSPVVADFMKTELADAHRVFSERLRSECWLDFYEQRVKIIPELANFSESSIKKMGTNVIKILADVHYLESGRTKILQNVYVLPETMSCAKELGKPEFVEALESGR
ncbi:DUF1819 family protein [Vibrio splendidus]|uniref:DUF1819 family protein n=1 Tax=Vibrio splendidus TaxID=29497 RepID=UPI0006CA303E|nr:DUF1819 family protein [Vibrio splendidus]KPM01481.1 hypothetical protein AN167_02915 [Vibrio splendidus]